VPEGSSETRTGADRGGANVDEPRFELTQIGTVESPLADLASVPKQGDEGAPDAWPGFAPAVLEGPEGLHPGDEIIVLTWLHHARRNVLRVHPRGDTSRAQQGVFTTRSPDRPNPIGLHRVGILSIDGIRIQVRNLEAVDGTPIVDLKQTLSSDMHER
jgi:tRNA-Thr(GGU) m(6)t(6)A37 methyltransferase TsaA